jgi:hypothetical protein
MGLTLFAVLYGIESARFGTGDTSNNRYEKEGYGVGH